MTALLFNSVMGMTVALVLGINPVLGAVLANVAAAILGQFAPQGALQAGVLTEVWTGELVKSLRSGLEGSWLDGIPDSSTSSLENGSSLSVTFDPESSRNTSILKSLHLQDE